MSIKSEYSVNMASLIKGKRGHQPSEGEKKFNSRLKGVYKVKKPSRIALKRRADKLFADKVKELGYCFRCGKSTSLQCAHIVSRSYFATRWDFENALCLCQGCHMYFTWHPLEWEKFIEEKFGAGYYKTLKDKALTHQKSDYETLIEELKSKGMDQHYE